MPPNKRGGRPGEGVLNVSTAVQTGDSLPPAAPVEPLTEPEARSLTGQIRSLGEGIADRVDLLVDKVRQARDEANDLAHAANELLELLADLGVNRLEYGGVNRLEYGGLS